MTAWRHWLVALLLGLFAGLLAWQWTLAATPGYLLKRAIGRLSDDRGANAMTFAPLATDAARAVVRPSPDLAYATCPFDVAKGPVVVEALPVPAPYWSLAVYDARTDVAFVRNNRQAAGRPIRIAIVRRGTAAPAGFEPVEVDGDRGIALIRVLVGDRAQFPAIDAARRLANCRSAAVG